MLLNGKNVASFAPLLAMLSRQAMAATPLQIEQVGSTLVSAMMMFLGSEEKVYILDKVEGNTAQLNGHPAFASSWDIASNQATAMEVITNPFCASGMHLPNGSFATFGGNGAIAPGGNVPAMQAYGTGVYDPVYNNWDGGNTVRTITPCSATNNECQWIDNTTRMLSRRWYSTAEPLADGTIVLLGGYTNGGYINRNYPNLDPRLEGGAANPTYEYYPTKAGFDITKADVQFVIDTSGLNSYPHMFLMPSGKIFVQANISSMLWDVENNQETRLPQMPGGVARVYPASGGVAMLPLTPANNYTPTVLFCGGIFMEDEAWGNYSWPFVNTWERQCSNDCQRITPEPVDGSPPAYEADDNMIQGRTMGQFIALPDGTLFMVNGGANGTAGYSTQTLVTPTYGQMPFGMSLAAEPVLTPAIYYPNNPKGSRWSNAGLGASKIPRLYHSSALLLPDGSVLIAGSNPNVDFNQSTIFPTTYTAEKFYPWYYSMSRPNPSGLPTTLSYGGASFDVKLDKSSYSGDANKAAMNSSVIVIRTGFTTHAMNMGQRFIELNNTYTVNSDGSIVLHTSQLPPNANLLQPGPALLFVVVNGVPSTGKMIIAGNGQQGQQPVAAVAVLPTSQNTTASISGNSPNSADSANGSVKPASKSAGLSTGAIVGLIAAAAVVVALVAGLAVVLARRKAARNRAEATAGRYDAGAQGPYGAGMGQTNMGGYRATNTNDSQAHIPLNNYGANASASRVDLHAPALYQDDPRASYDSRETGFSAAKAAPVGGQFDDSYYYDQSPQPHRDFQGRR